MRDSRKFGSEFLLRVLSAVIAAPIVIFLVFIGDFQFVVFISVGAGMMLYEWIRITQSSYSNARDLVLLFFVVLGSVFVGVDQLIPAAICYSGVILYALVVRGYSQKRLWLLLGIVYVVFSALSLIIIRSGENGLEFILGIFILVWATDIGGYFCGRILGGPKLWSLVSPKKTWSGAIGGLILGNVSLLLGSWIAGYGNWELIVLFGIFLSCISQLGDLAESALKRNFNTKDSGTIIPGHGGILDRVDGLVVTSIAVFAVGSILNPGGDVTLILGSFIN